MGKLSETLRGLIGHLDHYASQGVGLQQGALSLTKMISGFLHVAASTLEASDITIPAPKIPAPAGK